MTIVNTLWQFAEKIEKSNSCGIFFSLVSGPNDESFKQAPPVVQVTIFEKKGTDDDVDRYLDTNKGSGYYMSSNIPDDQKTFTFEMKGAGSADLWALVIPDQEWGDVYCRKWCPITLHKGKVSNLIVSLERK